VYSARTRGKKGGGSKVLSEGGRTGCEKPGQKEKLPKPCELVDYEEARKETMTGQGARKKRHRGLQKRRGGGGEINHLVDFATKF